jgi:hypothetical protein
VRRHPGSSASNGSSAGNSACKLRPEHAGSGIFNADDRATSFFPRGFPIGHLVFAFLFAIKFALNFALGFGGVFGFRPIAIRDASAGDSSSRANARRSTEYHCFASGCGLDHPGSPCDQRPLISGVERSAAAQEKHPGTGS